MTMLSDFDVDRLAQTDTEAIRREGLAIAAAEMPGYSPDAHDRDDDTLPASYSQVWPRVENMLQMFDDPANAVHVRHAFDVIRGTEAARYCDPCLILATAGRESHRQAFLARPPSGPTTTYGHGGLDNFGNTMRSGRLTGAHVPAEYLTRWMHDTEAYTTHPLTGTSDEGRSVGAAALDFRDFLIAYAAYFDLQFFDGWGEGEDRRRSMAVIGTAERYGYSVAEVLTLPSLARRIWHALFFGGPGGSEFGEGRRFGARTVLDFFRDNGHPMASITDIAALSGASSIVSQRRTRAAVSVALIAEAMDRVSGHARVASRVAELTHDDELADSDWGSLVHDLSVPRE